MKENRKLEFKESITNTFLKTVSAFANYDGGTILFGVDDNGKVVGLENLDQQCLDIENRINDSIKPKPDYSISTNNIEKPYRLTLKVAYINHIYIEQKLTNVVIQLLLK